MKNFSSLWKNFKTEDELMEHVKNRKMRKVIKTKFEVWELRHIGKFDWITICEETNQKVYNLDTADGITRKLQRYRRDMTDLLIKICQPQSVELKSKQPNTHPN